MITAAPWLAPTGYEAFFVDREIVVDGRAVHGGPCHLIKVDRRDMAARLVAGESLTRIVTGED